MTKILNKLEKWKYGSQPVPKEEVIAVLKKYFPGNYRLKSGSHIVVNHPSLIGLPDYGAKGEFTVATEGGKKVKPVYLRRLLKVIDYLSEIGAINKEVGSDEK
jgi:hypothetical protein